MKFVKPERIWLREHAEINEKWVQERICEDPSILGLGDLVLKDKERMQPRAGRLDILLQDLDTDRRYEVELQLGRTDESHIIRTIEYWDIEKKRYPQYDHCAVIVAEDITSRFLNVISLFNSAIPIIAIQMAAFGLNDQVALVFTTVLNELSRGLDEEDQEPDDVVDRGYWEARIGKDIMAMADRLVETETFVTFRPKRQFLRVEARVPKSDETDARLEEAGLDMMPYKWNKYRVRLTKADLARHEALVTELLKQAFDNRES